MPIVKSSSIVDIKQRVSLVDVASTHVQLKRAGSLMKGLSPFNQEKTPSFFVNPAKNTYNCYSSGKFGDVISFVMEMENLSFPEALETLSRRYGVPLEFEKGSVDHETISIRAQLYRLYEEVARHTREAFMAKDNEGKAIREYWVEQRGFSLEQAEEYGIGYLPADPKKILRDLAKLDFPDEVWNESGLLFGFRECSDVASCGMRLAGRLIISIRDIQKRVVAFSGRVTDLTPDGPTHEAKYVNSPETPIFQKSQILFGLDRARTHFRNHEPALVVEGQLDVLRCWAAGFDRTVAPQGTAITETQMALLRRFTETVDFILDGDRAGREAALRALPLAWKASLEPHFVLLPDGQDPDSLLLAEGPEGLNALLSQKRNAVDFLFQSLLPDGYNADPTHKRNFLEQLFSFLPSVSYNSRQKDILRVVAQRLALREDDLLTDFSRSQKNSRWDGTIPTQTGSTAPPASSIPWRSIEYDLLFFLLHNQDYGTILSQLVEPEWVDCSITEGRLLNRILAEFHEGEWSGEEHIDSILEEPAEQELIAYIRHNQFESDSPTDLANNCISKLYQRHLKSRIDEIDEQIHNQNNQSDLDLQIQLQGERTRLRRELKQPPQLPANPVP